MEGILQALDFLLNWSNNDLQLLEEDNQSIIAVTNDSADGLKKVKLENAAICIFCSSLELDMNLKKNFDENICKRCKYENKNDYELMTQSDVLSEYLITSQTVKSMKYEEKINPKKSGWAPMKLYLRKHARELGIKKWGTLDDIILQRNKKDNELFRKNIKKTSTIFQYNQDIPTLIADNTSINEAKKVNKTNSKRSQFINSALSAIVGNAKDINI